MLIAAALCCCNPLALIGMLISASTPTSCATSWSFSGFSVFGMALVRDQPVTRAGEARARAWSARVESQAARCQHLNESQLEPPGRASAPKGCTNMVAGLESLQPKRLARPACARSAEWQRCTRLAIDAIGARRTSGVR
jgi:hypothetical protein